MTYNITFNINRCIVCGSNIFTNISCYVYSSTNTTLLNVDITTNITIWHSDITTNTLLNNNITGNTFYNYISFIIILIDGIHCGI